MHLQRATLKRLESIALAASLLCMAGLAQAFDIRAVNDNVIVYDAGSKEARPQFILLAGTPVETIVTTDRWTKIRETSGGLGWIERSALVDRTQVLVSVAQAEIRQAPNASAPLVFSAGKDVLLTLLDKPAEGWIKVRHSSGQSGFVAVRSVWGL